MPAIKKYINCILIPFRTKALSGIFFLIIIHALINYIWLSKDSFPLWFDHGKCFERSIIMYYSSQTSIIAFVKAMMGFF
ncbi:MAG: hypothetical protein ACYSSI_07690, partial [Planctomycetota bacterium]